MLTLRDRLHKMVEFAPDEAMIQLPAGWLRSQLEEDSGAEVRTADGLSLEDVGRELHAAVGTVRKYIRDGKRGKSGRMILLRSFPGVGGQRVTEEALADFVKQLQAPAETASTPDLRVTPDMSIADRIEMGKRIAKSRGKVAQ